jgi:AcrR family transcriptional regulator
MTQQRPVASAPRGRHSRKGRPRTRAPGRPAVPVLGRDAILEAALALLERDGLAAVTLRAVARELGVDAMAIYHHVADKDALLRGAAALAYERLDPRAGTTGSWRQRLETLANAYVAMVGRAGELLRYLTAGSEATAEAAARFDLRFRAAIASLRLPERHHAAVQDAFVDFLHGFSLAVPDGRLTPQLARALRAELAVLFAGMQALARSARDP